MHADDGEEPQWTPTLPWQRGKVKATSPGEAPPRGPAGLDDDPPARVGSGQKSVPSVIANHYFERYVTPLLRLPGGLRAPGQLGFLAAQIERVRQGERPISIATLGSTSAKDAPVLARLLVDRGIERFHVDCLGVSEELSGSLRLDGRRLGVTGYLSQVTPDGVIPRRDPGVYDAVYSHDFLHRAEDRDALLSSIDGAMTDTSVLVLNEPIGSPGVEAEEAWQIVDYLLSKLLPRHGTHSDPDALRGLPRDSGLLQALARKFSPLECVPFGGIVDAFLAPSSGLSFDAKLREDVRFIDFVGDLEQRLRPALSPTRVIAALKKGTTKAQARLPALSPEPRAQLVIPEETWFDFEPVDEVVTHVMDGETDAPYLGQGFHTWERVNSLRWSGPLFTLRLPIPERAAKVTCHVEIECHLPVATPGGGATFFVGGMRVGRVENVYTELARDPWLRLEFETHGGPLEVTCVLDASQKMPDPVDERELSVAVRSFTAGIAWRK